MKIFNTNIFLYETIYHLLQKFKKKGQVRHITMSFPAHFWNNFLSSQYREEV